MLMVLYENFPSVVLAVLDHVFVLNLQTALCLYLLLAAPSHLGMPVAEDQLWRWLSSRPSGWLLRAPLEQQSCSRLDLFS